MLRGLFFFFNDTATTEIYTLSLHDALPISQGVNGVYWYPISGQTVERQAEGRLPDARAHVHYEGGATEVRPLERGRPGTPIESVYSSFAGARGCGLFDHLSLLSALQHRR